MQRFFVWWALCASAVGVAEGSRRLRDAVPGGGWVKTATDPVLILEDGAVVVHEDVDEASSGETEADGSGGLFPIVVEESTHKAKQATGSATGRDEELASGSGDGEEDANGDEDSGSEASGGEEEEEEA